MNWLFPTLAAVINEREDITYISLCDFGMCVSIKNYYKYFLPIPYAYRDDRNIMQLWMFYMTYLRRV